MPRKLTAARNASSMLAVPGLLPLPARMPAPRPPGVPPAPRSLCRQDIPLGEGIGNCRMSHLGGTELGLVWD